jgi:hypothetical protein
MKNELDILRDISGKLQQLGIPFMLTGSMALNFHAQPRFTRDIDIVVALTRADIPRLVEALSHEYYISEEDALSAVRLGRQFNLIHTESVLKVDCIVRKNTAHALAEFDRRLPVTIAGASTFVTTKEDLILAKLAWARDSRSQKQMADVKNLLSHDYDREYVEHWADRIGVRDLLEECRRA